MRGAVFRVRLCESMMRSSLLDADGVGAAIGLGEEVDVEFAVFLLEADGALGVV